MDKFSVAPLQENFIDIPYNYSALPQDKECVLTISFHSKKKTLGIKSNAEIAFDQFILNTPSKPVISKEGKAPSAEKKGNNVVVSGDNFTVKVDNGSSNIICC